MKPDQMKAGRAPSPAASARSLQRETASVRISAPARLHMGFLDMNGGLGRKFGSVGLSIDHPATVLTATPADHNAASGCEGQRAATLLERFTAHSAHRYRLDIETAIPAHAGLGSGTQLALAVGAAVATLEKRALSPADLAIAGERGARSGIGLASFIDGGFIIDGGRGANERPPPVTLRAEFPDNWRVLLILQPNRSGVSGDAETTAFAGLPEFPNAMAAHICHLVLMKMMPGLAERDISAFGSAITEIQQIVGWHFAGKQGGSPWTSPAVGRIAARMQTLGATGIGQSSWGPTGFAFVDGAAAAERLYHSLVEEAKGDGLEIMIVRGRNTGAAIDLI